MSYLSNSPTFKVQYIRMLNTNNNNDNDNNNTNKIIGTVSKISVFIKGNQSIGSNLWIPHDHRYKSVHISSFLLKHCLDHNTSVVLKEQLKIHVHIMAFFQMSRCFFTFIRAVKIQTNSIQVLWESGAYKILENSMALKKKYWYTTVLVFIYLIVFFRNLKIS